MADDRSRIVVLVHGWSVRSTDTYGELPARLEREARSSADLLLDIRNIWLGKYVSFADEIRLEDLSRAFDAAVERELGVLIKAGRRFVCITHSTGGPVIRYWWYRYYQARPSKGVCPMSHLIMLAPANFGSALAQLGKGRASRIKAWFEGVEPGEGVLEWLELGSPESWSLNSGWIDAPESYRSELPVFPFVLTGQSIDRRLYDNINTYTGELGSDGVVRVAAANLNATYVKLQQQMGDSGRLSDAEPYAHLQVASSKFAQRTAFALIKGMSHSGEDKGILRSIKDNERPQPTVSAILRCLLISDRAQYLTLCDGFDEDNERIRNQELIEIETKLLLPNRIFIHDSYSMLIFRLLDDEGRIVSDFDLVFTGIKGKHVGANFLPTGFIADRQRNRRHAGTITFYVNHTLMIGSPELRKGKTLVREERKGAEGLGLQVVPRPDGGFVHYIPGDLQAKVQSLTTFIKPNQTTLVDIVLKRIVREGTFTLTLDREPTDFTGQPPGEPIVDRMFPLMPPTSLSLSH
jgi:hypothetical protein